MFKRKWRKITWNKNTKLQCKAFRTKVKFDPDAMVGNEVGGEWVCLSGDGWVDMFVGWQAVGWVGGQLMI